MKDEEFIKWLEINEIKYDFKDKDLMLALYGEYRIEKK